MFALVPRKVRCFACEEIGPSHVNPFYWIAFLGSLVIAGLMLANSLSDGGFFFGVIGVFGIGDALAAMAMLYIAFRTFTAKAAHRCRKCGGAFVDLI